MQDMSPKLVFPLSLGMNERLRRPILDHMLLNTLQVCTVVIQLSHHHNNKKERERLRKWTK